jgi:inosine/xanthosine triphosphate pyrophosphatase family protein
LRLVLALAFLDGTVHTVEGCIRGIVAEKLSDHRVSGFPYRSLLYFPDILKYYDPASFSEEEQARYNHRGNALMKLKPVIKEVFGLV